MSAARDSLCECGHPKAIHYPENAPWIGRALGGPCNATVYTQVPIGMNATRCKCQRWEPKS